MTTTLDGQEPLEAQAALETAVVNLLRSDPPLGLGLRPAECQRMYDGHPPAAAGDLFASVWYDAQRGTSGQRTNLDEIFGVYVTLSLKVKGLPPDRWVQLRDQMEKKANAVKVLLCKDARDYRVVRAAQKLAGFRNPGSGDAGRPVGWVLGLVFQGFDPIEEKGAEWYYAQPSNEVFGLAQRIKFGQAQRVQAVATAT